MGVRVFLIAVATMLSAIGLAWCASPAAAADVSVYGQGDDGQPFTLVAVPSTVQVLGDADQRIELTPRVLIEALDKASPAFSQLAPGTDVDVRTAVPLDNGNLLVSSGRYGGYVAEINAAGTKVVWSYVNGVDGYLLHPFSAQPAVFNGKDCVLISDRWTFRVFAVTWDEQKQIVWQYGVTDEPGASVNQVADPFTAVQLEPSGSQVDGNVLIADSLDNHRCIEVRADDYDPGKPNSGYTAASIVWQYGTTGVGGTAVNQLVQVRSPQRLASGNTLIGDADGQRVIEVRTSDYDPTKPSSGYTAESIVWQYGAGGTGDLEEPNTARRVESGPLKDLTVIADTRARTLLWVNLESEVVDSLDTQSFSPPSVDQSDGSAPRGALYAADGSQWIPDPGYKRIIHVGNAGSARVTTAALDCDKPGVRKAFKQLTIKAVTPSKTSISVSYRVDSRGWQACRRLKWGRFFAFPGGATGKTITFRMTLTSSNRGVTPTLEGFNLQWVRPSGTGGDGGGGGGEKGDGDNSGDSGVYTYPGATGGTGSSGGGSGSGTSGSGSGSGSGSYGDGTGGSVVGGDSTSSYPDASEIEVPETPTVAGPSEDVSGYEVEGEEGVSGVPLKAAEGAQIAADEPKGQPLPVGLIAAAGVGVLAAFFLPWPVMAARMREVTGFNHTRPKYYRPFRLLGR
jgi:hypothetical protein